MITLQRYLDKLSVVAGSWNLSLNIDNCVFMRFSRKFYGWSEIGNNYEYNIGGVSLDVVKYSRDLGILVDVDLKFHHHVRELVCRASGLSNSLLRSTVNRSPEFMVTVRFTHSANFGLLLVCLECKL